MQIDINQLAVQSDTIQSCLILIAAIGAAQLLPLARSWQPLEWFCLLAKTLAHKVNHPERAVSQQMIAGILATIILVVPITVIGALLLKLAAFSWFFEFLVLYVCLSAYQFTQPAKAIAESLSQGNNQQAKNILSPWVSQSSQGLSSVGLCKTTIEKTLTTPLYGPISSIVFFAIGGASTVIAIHMLRQLELSWPPYHPRFKHFSSFVSQFNRMIFFVPKVIWHVSLAMQFGRFHFGSLVAEDKLAKGLNNDFNTVHLGAHLLKIELGGPQQFIDNKCLLTGALNPSPNKVEVAKIKAGPFPQYQHISTAVRVSQNGKFFFLTLSLITPIIWVLLRSM